MRVCYCSDVQKAILQNLLAKINEETGEAEGDVFEFEVDDVGVLTYSILWPRSWRFLLDLILYSRNSRAILVAEFFGSICAFFYFLVNKWDQRRLISGKIKSELTSLFQSTAVNSLEMCL